MKERCDQLKDIEEDSSGATVNECLPPTRLRVTRCYRTKIAKTEMFDLRLETS